MDVIMNENQLTIVIEYEVDKPLVQKIESIIDNSIGDCHVKSFHTFDHICAYYIQPANKGNNEIVNKTISDKSKNLYEINKN